MEPKTRFFDALFDAVAERVSDADPGGGLDISRYGARGLYFAVKRSQPARKVEVNFLGAGAFVHFGASAMPIDVVDTRVAVRMTDSATLTVDQWAASIMEFLLKPAPAQAAAAASAGTAKPKTAPPKPQSGKGGKK